MPNPNLKLNLENDLSVSIVNNYDDKSGYYSHTYNIFDIKKPIPNVGLLGVSSGERFAIKIVKQIDKDISFAIYFDGVPVNQGKGIKSLSNIPENQRSNIKNHKRFICKGSYRSTFYLERFSQINNENREFVFTNISNAGINENLISDPSRKSRIEIYFWKESEREEVLYSPRGLSEDYMKIGAGKVTNKKFSTTSGLTNPKYLGKLLFIYVDKNNINGKCKVPSGLEYDFDDPMDQVPES